MDLLVCLKALCGVVKADARAADVRAFYYRQRGLMGHASRLDGVSYALNEILVELEQTIIQAETEKGGEVIDHGR